MLTPQNAGDMVALVRKSVSELHTPGYYKGVHLELSLGTAQERWELLVLATLLAARVSEAVAEATFLALRRSGLLHFPLVLEGHRRHLGQVHEILAAEYQALADRRRKVESLPYNARLLHEQYGGDLQQVYEQTKATRATQTGENQGPSSLGSLASMQVVQRLQQFQQIRTRAHWICRCMCEAGLWTLRPEAALFYDVHVRRALSRLGLICNTKARGVMQHDMEIAVNTYFAGDATPLYRLGRYLCSSADPELCRDRCWVHGQCAYFGLER